VGSAGPDPLKVSGNDVPPDVRVIATFDKDGKVTLKVSSKGQAESIRRSTFLLSPPGTVSATPEPASLTLLGLGALSLAGAVVYWPGQTG
jgi:hypothetical protein